MHSRGLEFIRQLRAEFIKSYFDYIDEPLRRRKVDVGMAMRIADLFEAAKHEPENADVLHCYQTLAFETISQFEYLLSSGLNVDPWMQSGEPYSSSNAMELDVATNHIYFLPTFQAHGESTSILDQSKNPLLCPTKFSIKNYTLLMNDIFRVVHDIFGHAADGNQFGPVGEENAWLSHSTMFTFDARKALTTETRGQNSWFNFGPHLRHANGELYSDTSNEFVPIADRPYAPQKMTIMPSWVVNVAD